MNTVMEFLYAPIQPFVWHPERAFIAAAIFIGLVIVAVFVNKGTIKIKPIMPLLMAFGCWVLFGINEYIAHSTKTDIRIDLLFFGPAIMLISAYAIYAFMKCLFTKK